MSERSRGVHQHMEEKMKVFLASCAFLSVTAFGTGTVLADDHGNRPFKLSIDRHVDTFAVLPSGVSLPEVLRPIPRTAISTSRRSALRQAAAVRSGTASFLHSANSPPRCSVWSSTVSTRSTSPTSAISLAPARRSSASRRIFPKLENVAEIPSVGAPAHALWAIPTAAPM